MTQTQYLKLTDGTIAFDDQGEASANWPAYTDAALGSDMIALIKHLGVESAFIIGTSKGTGAALQAALQAPELVKGLVLIGAFVAAPKSALFTSLLNHLIFFPLWGVELFGSYYSKMYPKARPADYDEHLNQVKAMLKEPGRLRAIRLLFSETSGATYARHSQVQAPTLILMGSRDPDFSNPAQEAHTLAGRLPHATAQIIEGAGHHLQVEVPEIVGPEILAFFSTIEQKVVSDKSK